MADRGERGEELLSAPVMVVRGFGDSDLDSAFLLDQICFPPGIAYSKTELRYFLASASRFAIVAEKAGRMAGFLIADWNGRPKRAAHIVTIDVAQQERRSGVGSLLMDTAETHYAGAGCAALLLEVAVDNTGAQSFYSRRGFRLIGRRKGYYNGVLDAFTMSKSLAGE